MKQRRHDEGFTLIEILIVVVIIGVLAAIAVVVFLNQRNTARDASVKTDLKNVAVVIENGYENLRHYPDDTEIVSLDPAISPGNSVFISYLNGRGEPTTPALGASYQMCGVNEESGAVYLYDSSEGGLAETKVPTGTDGCAGDLQTTNSGKTITWTGGEEDITLPVNASPVAVAYSPPPNSWVLSQGSSPNVTATATTLSMRNGTRTVSPTPWEATNIQISTTATATPTNGYGILFRARTSGANQSNVITGYTFQVDKGLGDRFAMRVWKNNSECGSTLASTPWPAGFNPATAHDVQITAIGDTFTAKVNGTEVMNIPSLSSVVASRCPAFAPAPDGSQYGFRTWGSVQATFTNTQISTPS